MAAKRRKLLHYMGSKMAKDCWDDASVDLPKEYPVGLSVIPKGWRILAKRGFTFISRSFPNFNEIDTPTRLGGLRMEVMSLVKY